MAPCCSIRSARICALVLLLVFMTVGCGDKPTEPSGTDLRVASVTPNSGQSVQATPIQVTGTGFAPGATLSLGGSIVESSRTTSKLIVATAPPHAAGPVDIVVTNPDGQSGHLARGFTYLSALRSFTLDGSTTMTAAGQTTQLSAILAYADGSARDISSEVRWGSSMVMVATVSLSGLVSAAALGNSTISAEYPSLNPTMAVRTIVTVTPAGTFTATGRVRHPGEGSLGNARVFEAASGQVFMTQNNGLYAFGGLLDGRLSITRDGFEPVAFMATRDGFDEPPMQHVVRLEVGGPAVQETLAPNDVGYDDVAAGTSCRPCRLIRITSSTTGTARIHIVLGTSPILGTPTLSLWAGGQAFESSATREIRADLPIAAGIELVVYVGTSVAPGDYVPFTMSVSPGG